MNRHVVRFPSSHGTDSLQAGNAKETSPAAIARPAGYGVTTLGPRSTPSENAMHVDSFRFLPRSFRSGYDLPPTSEPPVWAPFTPRLADATITLLTSGGLYDPATQPSFDLDRERREPRWGDPTMRMIDHAVSPLAMAHLHVNPTDILADHDVALPRRALDRQVARGVVGAASVEHVSVMGYQGDLATWRDHTAPEIVRRCRDLGTDGIVLAPV